MTDTGLKRLLRILVVHSAKSSDSTYTFLRREGPPALLDFLWMSDHH